MNKRIALILLIAPLTFIVLTKIIPCLTWRSDIKREFVVRDAEGKAIEEARVYLLIRQGGERVWPVTLALPWYVDKRYNDMDEALSHPVKVQEGGKFTIDVKLYYPSQAYMCVIAPGYYPTLVRVDTKGCEVLLLDEQRHTAVREEADVNWFDDLKQTGRVFCRRTILADLELYPYIRWDNSEWITRGNMRYPAESRLPFDSFERYIQDGVGAEEAKKVGWILFFLCSRSVPTKYYYHVEEELAAEETPSFLKQAPNERARIYTPAFIQDELTEAQRKELNLK